MGETSPPGPGHQFWEDEVGDWKTCLEKSRSALELARSGEPNQMARIEIGFYAIEKSVEALILKWKRAEPGTITGNILESAAATKVLPPGFVHRLATLRQTWEEHSTRPDMTGGRSDTTRLAETILKVAQEVEGLVERMAAAKPS